MRFTNLTRDTEIGANSYLLEGGGARFVLDCGMHPKREGEDATPLLGLIGDEPLDAIVISHAHLDHIGSLPLLTRRKPAARVFMTEATMPLTDVLLHNSINVMTKQREALGISSYPLFTHREADNAAATWMPCPLQQRFSIEGDRLRPDETCDLPTFQFFDAGHIMGSAGILIEAEGRKFFYTGDVNFDDQTISQGARFPEDPVDVLIIESTRGDSPVSPDFSRQEEEKRLCAAIRETFERGGAVLIPVFALGKTQELLAMLHFARREGVLKESPIYIGGLSTKITEIYDRFAGRVPRNHPKLNLLEAVAPYVVNGKNADQTPIKPGRVYALSSGMMSEKTLSHLFAKTFLTNPLHSIFFIGYADPDSPAGHLKRTPKGQSVALDDESPPIEVACDIRDFSFSAHGNRDSLLRYILKMNPKKVVLVHGDVPAVEWFRSELAKAAPQMQVIVPPSGQTIDL